MLKQLQKKVLSKTAANDVACFTIELNLSAQKSIKSDFQSSYQKRRLNNG